MDGRLIKGAVEELHGKETSILVSRTDQEGGDVQVPLEELKAIFYVRELGGDASYHEQKRYGLRERLHRKIIIRFKDGEFLVGFLDSELPWNKGFFLSADPSATGFYLIPADEHSNNLKVFVVSSAVEDVTTP